ncbi:NAD(P)H-dependent oxidoreductase [Hansschlegelia sp.]|uniref:NAD(P)H-dependent oxidoreductase n=1 Tax=Hansschlegelia sp. TaxID=2041892 RepID=UPI002C6B5BDB|nr:NAD(P)H-dependent oxidoreductase [Hansschlegelia sp.]HVI28701.1 NAD(P)H-dependent oxidoreductase [Hansschlegelia sp.]
MPLLVCINGSPRRESRTGIVIDAVADAIAASTTVERGYVRLADDGGAFLTGLMRDRLSERGLDLLRLIERADLLVVGAPVYRAGYPGVMKHLFDLLDRRAMRGRKSVLVATGGTPFHALMLEHQLRPLMGFFGMWTTPTTIYAVDSDFSGRRIANAELLARVSRAAREAVSALMIGADAEDRAA